MKASISEKHYSSSPCCALPSSAGDAAEAVCSASYESGGACDRAARASLSLFCQAAGNAVSFRNAVREKRSLSREER